MLNYTIGAVKKKKSTAKKKTTTTKAKTASKKTKKASFPSTPTWMKDYKVSSTCTKAGSELKTKRTSSAGAILALCRASVKNLKTTAAALKKYGVTKGKLSRNK
jgi:hypothetical protein